METIHDVHMRTRRISESMFEKIWKTINILKIKNARSHY